MAGSGLSSVTLTASSPLEKYPAKQHVWRTVEKLKAEKGLIYLIGEKTRHAEDSDLSLPFRQRRYFYYVTGVNEPDCHVTYDIEEDWLTLYIPETTIQQAIWNGRGLTIDAAKEKYDVDEVVYSKNLEHDIEKWTSKNHDQVYILHKSHAPPHTEKLGMRVNGDSLQDAMNRARVIKDSHEVGLIRKANEITAAAHTQVLKHIKKFKSEAQVAGIFVDTCTSQGAKEQAYEPIAASGDNAAVLHYIKNDELFHDRQLMVLDAACNYDCYAADVTRTFPLNGKWTKEAEAIYSLVQKMQDQCVALLRPEALYTNIQAYAHRIAADGLLNLGILKDGSTDDLVKEGLTKAFFPHGLGHHIGLETHDVGYQDLIRSGIEEMDAGYVSKEDDRGDRWRCHAADCQKVFKGLQYWRRHFAVRHQELCKAHETRMAAKAASASPKMINGEVLTDGSHFFRNTLLDEATSMLEPGMVLTVEPGIYFNKTALDLFLSQDKYAKYIDQKVLARYMPVGGVRIEDNYAITDEGYELISTAPKALEMLNFINQGVAAPSVIHMDTATPQKADAPSSTLMKRPQTPPSPDKSIARRPPAMQDVAHQAPSLSSEESCKCTECGRPFVRKQLLDKHFQTVHSPFTPKTSTIIKARDRPPPSAMSPMSIRSHTYVAPKSKTTKAPPAQELFQGFSQAMANLEPQRSAAKQSGARLEGTLTDLNWDQGLTLFEEFKVPEVPLEAPSVPAKLLQYRESIADFRPRTASAPKSSRCRIQSVSELDPLEALRKDDDDNDSLYEAPPPDRPLRRAQTVHSTTSNTGATHAVLTSPFSAPQALAALPESTSTYTSAERSRFSANLARQRRALRRPQSQILDSTVSQYCREPPANTLQLRHRTLGSLEDTSRNPYYPLHDGPEDRFGDVSPEDQRQVPAMPGAWPQPSMTVSPVTAAATLLSDASTRLPRLTKPATPAMINLMDDSVSETVPLLQDNTRKPLMRSASARQPSNRPPSCSLVYTPNGLALPEFAREAVHRPAWLSTAVVALRASHPRVSFSVRWNDGRQKWIVNCEKCVCRDANTGSVQWEGMLEFDVGPGQTLDEFQNHLWVVDHDDSRSREQDGGVRLGDVRLDEEKDLISCL